MTTLDTLIDGKQLVEALADAVIVVDLSMQFGSGIQRPSACLDLPKRRHFPAHSILSSEPRTAVISREEDGMDGA